MGGWTMNLTISVLIYILIVVVIAAVLDYVQGRIPMPSIGHMIARIIIWLCALLYILKLIGVWGGPVVP
jgi:hypothetical protein